MFTNVVRSGENDVRALVIDMMEDRKHDPWGSVTNTMFAMLGALYRAGYDIPPEYEYRAGAGIAKGAAPDREGESDTFQFWSLLDANSFADEPMLDWLRILDKYRALCVAAERNY